MNQTIASRIATGLLYAAVASVPLAALTAPAAHAEDHYIPRDTPIVAHFPETRDAETPAWTKHDKKVMKGANKACKKIKDDVTYEFCVVGAFHLNDAGSSSGRVLTDEDYTYGAHGRIVLVQADGTVA